MREHYSKIRIPNSRNLVCRHFAGQVSTSKLSCLQLFHSSLSQGIAAENSSINDTVCGLMPYPAELLPIEGTTLNLLKL